MEFCAKITKFTVRITIMQRTPWVNRKFEFGIPPGWIYNILERLQGTGVRIRELTAGIPDARAALRNGPAWSIKEHIGHLTDLEELHLGRINDFVFRVPVLRAADMTNLKTEQASHNEKPLVILISDFISARENLIRHFEKLDEETHNFSSLHPRLKIQMRPVDMAFFTAEHDDHHIATMRMLVREGARI